MNVSTWRREGITSSKTRTHNGHGVSVSQSLVDGASAPMCSARFIHDLVWGAELEIVGFSNSLVVNTGATVPCGVQ